MKTVSILVPTRAPNYNPPPMPFTPHEVLTSNLPGVARARIDLVNRSTGELLIMQDDDITVQHDLVWRQALNLERGTFIMVMGCGHPITRFMVIHREDYQKVGGFDESFQNGEDYDFYLRALKNGLLPLILAKEAIHHREHPRRFDLRVPWDAGKLRAIYPEIIEAKWFVKFNPLVFLTQIVSLVYHNIRKSDDRLQLNGPEMKVAAEEEPYKRVVAV